MANSQQAGRVVPKKLLALVEEYRPRQSWFCIGCMEWHHQEVGYIDRKEVFCTKLVALAFYSELLSEAERNRRKEVAEAKRQQRQEEPTFAARLEVIHARPSTPVPLAVAALAMPLVPQVPVLGARRRRTDL